MTLEEAIAIYLYIRFHPPGERDEDLLNRAWGVIHAHATKIIEHERR